MQLDFFRQLASVFVAAGAPAAESQKPAAACISSKAGSDLELEKQARELLNAIGCNALAHTVQVVWNPRMRSTAGTAYAGRSLVKLNPQLRAFGAEEVDRTLRHELAHLLAHYRAGRRRIQPHGEEWRRACRDLGLRDEKRCHELPLPRRQLKARYLYRCPACQLRLERVRPIRRKSACLKCCRAHNRGQYAERFRLVRVAVTS